MDLVRQFNPLQSEDLYLIHREVIPSTEFGQKILRYIIRCPRFGMWLTVNRHLNVDHQFFKNFALNAVFHTRVILILYIDLLDTLDEVLSVVSG
jgi:hypothetical protein